MDNNVIAYDAPHMPFSLKNINYNSPNMVKGTVAEELSPQQPPLGSKFKNYQLNQAVNYYTLDPFQYSITKFDYSLPNGNSTVSAAESQNSYAGESNAGLVYRGINFEKLLPSFTATKKSVNDFTAQSYHRFEANNGYFNPMESVDNTDLWYYGADDNARINGYGIAGAPLNVQEVNHIIFPETQRGGTNSKNLAKYSYSNFTEERDGSWEGRNINGVDNNQNCQFFNYNSGYTTDRNAIPFEKVYSFDSDYARSIGINAQYTGSMPFNPTKIL